MDHEKVAPHAGAWIETAYIYQANGTSAVAPHAGAWIETIPLNNMQYGAACRTSRRCVD
ncbi:cytoplasmic protein [Providencia burhodogranariea DSM 19968]|uniref:Cytoplasmic protein n=1 Tax=Providencia burhodogranariea DSM 19968 TaxID=1141662 RepID=K8WSM7_9GAMM|nr:cytoplasmic protein [Providencia burhodogranariea DSM 19968]